MKGLTSSHCINEAVQVFAALRQTDRQTDRRERKTGEEEREKMTGLTIIHCITVSVQVFTVAWYRVCEKWKTQVIPDSLASIMYWFCFYFAATN